MKKIIVALCCVVAILALTNIESQATVPTDYKGVCKPRVTAPKELVCVITEGTKTCNVDSDCTPPVTD